jgi:uncharacterized protein (DUF1330 family)
MEDAMKMPTAAALAALAGFALGGASIQALHAQAKPRAYVVVEVDVKNTEGFHKEYSPPAYNAIKTTGAKYLARGGKTVAIDGEPPKGRTLLIEFDSLEQAQAAYASPAYRESRKLGDQHAQFRIWAMEGVVE